MNQPFRFCPHCGSQLALKNHSGQNRMCCPSCDFVHWNNPVPVVAALVEMDSGAVVLVHHVHWPEKMFGLVTGFVEAGESPEQAVVREVQEELGLAGSVSGLIGLYNWPHQNQLIIAYHVRASGSMNLGEELDRYKLLDPAQLRPWPFGTGLAVADWLEQLKQRRQQTG